MPLLPLAFIGKTKVGILTILRQVLSWDNLRRMAFWVALGAEDQVALRDSVEKVGQEELSKMLGLFAEACMLGRLPRGTVASADSVGPTTCNLRCY